MNFHGCFLYFGTFWNLGKVVSDAKTYACCGVFHKGCLRHTSQGEPSWVPWEKSAKTNWQFRAWKLNLSFAWHFVSFELASLRFLLCFLFLPQKSCKKKTFKFKKNHITMDDVQLCATGIRLWSIVSCFAGQCCCWPAVSLQQSFNAITWVWYNLATWRSQSHSPVCVVGLSAQVFGWFCSMECACCASYQV